MMHFVYHNWVCLIVPKLPLDCMVLFTQGESPRLTQDVRDDQNRSWHAHLHLPLCSVRSTLFLNTHDETQENPKICPRITIHSGYREPTLRDVMHLSWSSFSIKDSFLPCWACLLLNVNSQLEILALRVFLILSSLPYWKRKKKDDKKCLRLLKSFLHCTLHCVLHFWSACDQIG